jgi:hypothetical protein
MWRPAVCTVLAATVLAAPAHAAPGSGPRETIEIKSSTSAPGSPAGVTYTAVFHNPSNPSATPPPLRRLVLVSTPGGRVDTSVPARCTATDAELKQKGEAACPAASRIGHGTADVKPAGLPAIHYETVVFNAADQQVELLKGRPPFAPAGVVRGFYRGRTFDSPIPTCLNGGYVPADCPSDQVTLLRNTVVTPAYTVGSGASRRSYITTPPTCSGTRRWRSTGTFHFGDGAVETVGLSEPCVPARTRLRVSPRRVRRLARRRFRFKAEVQLGGNWRPLAGALIRTGARRLRTDGAGRVSGRIRFRRSGRRRAVLTLDGYRSATTRIRVLKRAG